MKILIAYASRHGGTKGIAEHLGAVLAGQGIACAVSNVQDDPDPSLADACLLGSGVYMGSWLNEAIDYGWRHAGTLATRPVWFFSSGPLPGSAAGKAVDADDPLAIALGPAEGPGSGGRKKIAALTAAVHPRDHRIFFGAYDPKDSPKSIAERFLHLLPVSDDILPAGDFRDWPAIEAWAREIGQGLAESSVR